MNKMPFLNVKVIIYLAVFLCTASAYAKDQIRENGVNSIKHEDPNYIGKPKLHKTEFKLPKAITLDEHRYTKNTIIGSFLHAVFSNTMWFEDSQNGVGLLAKKKGSYEDLPKIGVINKWQKPIKIVLKTLDGKSVQHDFLVQHIKELIPLYSKVSGLQITFSDREVASYNDANVFIVLNADSKIFNAFKNQRAHIDGNQTNYEQDYITAVRFTPDKRSQVEGFFIPNAENEIEAATCYLKPSLLSDELTKKLATECLGRVLGLPETSTNNKGILSSWNSDFDEISDLYVSDGAIYRAEFKEAWLKQLNEKMKKLEVKSIYPNEFDLKLVSALYCPSVKMGMDKHRATLALLSDETCIQQEE